MILGAKMIQNFVPLLAPAFADTVSLSLRGSELLRNIGSQE
jgi:hypothetical protein